MNSKSKSQSDIPDFAPGDLSHDTSIKHFERGAKPLVESNRWFLMSIILGIGIIVESIAFNMLFPLKTVETIQVIKTDGGRLVADGTAVGNWEPDSDSVGYFLNKWANSVFDINRATIDATIRESAEIAVGTAAAQLKELRTKDNPLISLQNNPEFSRTYRYISINFIQDGVAFLRFKTTTRKGGQSTEVTYAMKVSFTRVKPTNREQVMRNPAGIFITNFNITEEAITK